MAEFPFQIDRSPANPRYAGQIRTLVLTFPRAGLAVFRISPRARTVGWIFIAGGLIGLSLAAILFLFVIPRLPTYLLAILLTVVAVGELMPIVIGALMLTGRLRSKPVSFDLGQGRFWQGPAPADPFSRAYDIKNIAAIQLCMGGTDSRTAARATELNLVLRDPPGKRLTAVSHGEHDALAGEAAQLAQFLRVPLLDHTAKEPSA